jgi:erythromycin esterase-like protein
VAVEGDWPDCYAVDRCVRLAPGAPEDPRVALDAFTRWPTWMWANEDVLAFLRWLRAWNAERPEGERTGFYGLDVYSLWDSLRAVRRYVADRHPEHGTAADDAIRCFEPYRDDAQAYAWSTVGMVPESCEAEAVELLRGLLRSRTGGDDPAARLDLEQNAAVIVGAERYYRTMLRGDASSWNVRDVHMADTLDRLLAFHGPEARAVVWEHNTHVGDARATDMRRAGMVNVGQLARERHGRDGVALIGFSGYRGTVVAAGAWDAPPEELEVPPAREGSLEALLHEARLERALLVWPGDGPRFARRALDHRAIGVVYHPERERFGNYVPTVAAERYDALLHFEHTSGLAPLHGEPSGERELETFPSGV